MIFKEMKDTDLVRVLELEQACFKQPWLEKDCLYELNENPFSHGWILEDEDTIVFKGNLLSIDGKQKFEIEKNVPINEWKKLGFHCAKEILDNGGTQLMQEIKEKLKKYEYDRL